MKKLISVILIVFVVFIGLSIAKNAIAKTAISSSVNLMTGMRLNIRTMNVGVLRTLVAIKDLTVFNPAGFPDKIMVDLPEVYVNYKLGAFLKGKVHLEEVRLHLRELTIVRNEKGELNVDALKRSQEEGERNAASSGKKGTVPSVQIDLLDLKVGKVIYKDYTGKGTPRVMEFNVNLHERHRNITNPYLLAGLIVTRATYNTAIAQLASFDLEKLQALSGQMTGMVKGYSDQVTQVASQTTLIGKETVGTAKEAAGKAKEAASETVDALKKIIPFGE